MIVRSPGLAIKRTTKLCTLVKQCLIPLIVLSPQVPVEAEPLTQWLYQLFYDKEEQLSAYYRTGRLEAQPAAHHGGRHPLPPPRRLRHDPLAWLLRHIFFIGSTLLQLRLAGWVAQGVWAAAAAAGALVW